MDRRWTMKMETHQSCVQYTKFGSWHQLILWRYESGGPPGVLAMMIGFPF
jgi:hypothetical protein